MKGSGRGLYALEREGKLGFGDGQGNGDMTVCALMQNHDLRIGEYRRAVLHTYLVILDDIPHIRRFWSFLIDVAKPEMTPVDV